MEANRLAYVQGLTRQQQTAVRAALVRATREGSGTNTTARLLQRAIGLNPTQQRQLETFATAQRTARTAELEIPESTRWSCSANGR